MDSGLVDMNYSEGLLNHHTRRLVEHFGKMMSERMFSPFDGPIYDNAGNIKFEKDQTANHQDILEMDWYVDGIEELNKE